MKTTINQVNTLINSIFIRIDQGEFIVLMDLQGDTIHSLGEAIDFVRKHMKDVHGGVELSSFQQASLGNAEWDNF